MNRVRFWPHGVLAIIGVAVLAGIGVALWMRYDRSVEASTLPNAARIERVEGQVGINQSAENANQSRWTEATVNTPLTVGDRIYTKENSKTQIAFSGRNFATVDPNTSLDVLDLSEHKTHLALRSGSALFDVGSISSSDLFEVATPCGAVDFREPGLYQVAINEDGTAVATAFSGAAEVLGQNGSSRIGKGEYLAVSCQSAAPAVMSRVDPNQAGPMIDNYYRNRYPRTYDGRYSSYYTYLDDPYYYEPEDYYPSYNYVSDYIPGIYDLDGYGDWQYVNDYGYAWRPRVDDYWAPYQTGYWTMDYPFGMTWVSNEPWGYAPYHYGRWAYVSNDWYWIPESTRAYSTYSPALVAFLPLGDAGIGWVALGPGDPYVNRYYDPYWQPTYAYPSNVVVERVVNLSVPGAVTVVPVQGFTGVIEPTTVITTVNPQTFGKVRPVLDPLTVDPVRQVAFQTRETRRRFDVPGHARQLADRAVLTTTTPVRPELRRDLGRALKVERLSDRAKGQKLQVADQRSQTAAPQPNIAVEQARQRQMVDLSRRAERGDSGARRQVQELRKQQGGPARLAGARVQAERISQPMRQEPARVRRSQQRLEGARVQGERVSQQVQPAPRQQAAPRIRYSQQPQPVRQMPQAPARRAEPQYQRPAAQPRVMAPQPQFHRQQNERRAAPVRQAPQPQAQRPQPQVQRQQQPQVQRQQQPQVQRQPQPQVQRQQPQAQQQQKQVQQQQAQPKQSKPAEQKGAGKKKP